MRGNEDHEEHADIDTEPSSILTYTIPDPAIRANLRHQAQERRHRLPIVRTSTIVKFERQYYYSVNNLNPFNPTR